MNALSKSAYDVVAHTIYSLVPIATVITVVVIVIVVVVVVIWVHSRGAQVPGVRAQ
jgi:hypothetical protein